MKENRASSLGSLLTSKVSILVLNKPCGHFYGHPMAPISLPSQLESEAVRVPSSLASLSTTSPPLPSSGPHELPVCCPVRQKKQRQWIGPTGVNQSSKCPQRWVSLSPGLRPQKSRSLLSTADQQLPEDSALHHISLWCDCGQQMDPHQRRLRLLLGASGSVHSAS